MHDKYAILHHSRWLEEEEPLATVVYSRDGFTWHDICVCSPEWAEEIATALNQKEKLSLSSTSIEELEETIEKLHDDLQKANKQIDEWSMREFDKNLENLDLKDQIKDLKKGK
jgi:hypothetical protein